MNRNKHFKVGDAVPVDYYIYYVVEKTFEKSVVTHKEEDNDVFYKVGDPIFIKRRQKDYYKNLIEKLSSYCRIATDEEAAKFHEKLNFNACIAKVNEDGSYDVWHFWVVEKYINEIKNMLDMETDNCFWSLRSEITDYIEELCCSNEILGTCVGVYNGTLFLFNKFFDDDYEALLNISRKATMEESRDFSLYVFEVQESYRRKFKEEEDKRKEILDNRYEENKSNPEYFPGAVGNYLQVLVDKDGKVVPEKQYSLYQIKKFYRDLLFYEGLSDEVRNSLIFYGGTVPYILCNEKGDTRVFGDVDIFVPVAMMKKLRYDLSRKLVYIYDSLETTKKVGLTAKDHGLKRTYSFWSANSEYFSDFLRRKEKNENEILEKVAYQDYGFKAELFGIRISVFPLYNWTFEDGSIGVCAKSFRLSKKVDDWNFLLNTTVSKGITVENFYKEVSILGKTVKVVKPEYTIASKRNAIKFRYKLRKDKDLADLEYIESHKQELGIDENQTEFFMNNIPDFGISHVYRITPKNEAEVWLPKTYRDNVTTSYSS